MTRTETKKTVNMQYLYRFWRRTASCIIRGIVDVSYKYPKMYVIRPQFFIPMITLLRKCCAQLSAIRQELEIIRNQNIDISHFEEDMNDF